MSEASPSTFDVAAGPTHARIDSVVTERPLTRVVLIAAAVVFLLLFLVLPLLAVFQQAFAKGLGAYLNPSTIPTGRRQSS